MIQFDDFWSQEAASPLLDKNDNNFLQTRRNDVLQCASTWPARTMTRPGESIPSSTVAFSSPMLQRQTTQLVEEGETNGTNGDSSSTSNQNATLRPTVSFFSSPTPFGGSFEIKTSSDRPPKLKRLPSIADRTKEKMLRRIFLADAERTFAGEECRTRLLRLLAHLVDGDALNGEYHQGMCFVVGFLLLILDEPSIVKLIGTFAKDSKYIPGYWHYEPVAMARDAYVFEHILYKTFPEVATHIKNYGLQPHTYCGKWFAGLCVHLLPFSALVRFLDRFVDQGYPFLLRFGLSLVKHLRNEILASNETHSIFALLRLEPRSLAHRHHEDIYVSMVRGADEFDLSNEDLEALRTAAYNTHIKPVIDRANEAIALHKSRSADDSDVEEGEECEECKENMPEFLCNNCVSENTNQHRGKMLCQMCHEEGRGGHSPASHKTSPYES
eukprot:TRINITY_DN3010_c0_g1_i1.p1 TRINITY_DN3010_c0_g1~~TRINITY_DN3010_c0_g1_i1.p1  ORF type:complete len:441 (+),score=56.12 TRINITY_DN3010_c0_g1_i1:73-1395(+)